LVAGKRVGSIENEPEDIQLTGSPTRRGVATQGDREENGAGPHGLSLGFDFGLASDWLLRSLTAVEGASCGGVAFVNRPVQRVRSVILKRGRQAAVKAMSIGA
jgi:hypothetical protein